jgi:hypothetical protein
MPDGSYTIPRTILSSGRPGNARDFALRPPQSVSGQLVPTAANLLIGDVGEQLREELMRKKPLTRAAAKIMDGAFVKG